MTSLRRLSVHECSAYAARAAVRSPVKSQSANHHYWASRSGKPYGRSNVYTRISLYKRWLYQRDTQAARACGSWSRRKYGAQVAGGQSYDKTDAKPAETETKPKETSSSQRGVFGEEYFFNLLRHDASAAYRYLQKELENDPYRWLYDTRREDRNPFDWLDKRREAFEKRMFPWSRTIGKTLEQKPEPKQESTAEVEEFVIDPITLRKVPRQPKTDVDAAKESTTGSGPMNVVHDIPIKKFKEEAAQTLSAFKPPSSLYSSKDSKLAGFANQPWLVKEGFTAAKDNSGKLSSIAAATVAPSVRLEPSLNRVSKPVIKPASNMKPTSIPNSSAQKVLEYPPKETTTDDVDLLRASDIRAASGHLKAKSDSSVADRQAKSAALKKDWQDSSKNYTEDLLGAYNQVLEKRHKRLQDNAAQGNGSSNLSGEDFQKVKRHYDELRAEIKQTAKILEKARQQVLHDRLALETDSLRKVFDDFDTRSRKQMSVVNDARERVQELCISTATAENTDVALREKLRKLKRDAQLVAEVKAIYEDRYGKITTEHRQPLDESPTSMSSAMTTHTTLTEPKLLNSNQIRVRDLLYTSIDGMSFSDAIQKRMKFALRGVPELDTIVEKPSEPLATSVSPSYQPVPVESQAVQEVTQQPKQLQTPQDRSMGLDAPQFKKPEVLNYVYKILALDNATNEVAIATTSSSIKHKPSVPRSAAGLLVHLDHPAKYFPYMESLDKEGFKLVSGSRTMLVYRRRVDEDGESVVIESAPKKVVSRDMNPLREEPVFSGHLRPRERLLRSYQLAHRRARAAQSVETQRDKPGQTTTEAPEVKTDSAKNRPFWRRFADRAGLVALAVTACYMIGLVNAHHSKMQIEEGQRLRREEALARRRAETQKNEWNWF